MHHEPVCCRSKDAEESLDYSTPRSSDVRRCRRRRIDLGLPRPTSRVTAGSGAGDSPSSAADSGSVARPTPLARRAPAAAAAGREATPQRSRVDSGDVDGSDDRPPATRPVAESVDSRPSRGSDEHGDLRTTVPRSPEPAAAAGGASRARSAMPPPRRQPTASQQRRPPTTTAARYGGNTAAAGPAGAPTTMSKSASQPSFLAMLVSGTAVTAARPAATCARDHVTADTRRVDDNAESTAANNHNDDNNNNEDDQDDDDEDDEMKRQRIEDWLQRLGTVVLERPPSPVIDDDVPLQTDTAIHIVYDGD